MLSLPDLPISDRLANPSPADMTTDLQSNLALKKLRDFDPDAVEEARVFRNEVTVYLRPSRFLGACKFVRDEAGLKFKFLADVTAVDLYPQEPRFEVVYHLLSIETAQRLRLKVRVPGDNPRCVTAVSVWPSANPFEREVFDLFGITFDGHPYLRRMMLPDDWAGHPLRKDYPTGGFR
jgi:NADH-quinone oxidoreductase subunit C